ncbi:HNH endonuclease signature motif containing protein [Cerasicoccus frondis]|uniref:HNH endonuclease signature motif containing protein n=1 Tax=Cerasicoccus frondis TaxID=490090 RepID=UPI002852996D|nr:HNH endonuclease signature motif containing protein [Cerasicoccus frondis]
MSRETRLYRKGGRWRKERKRFLEQHPVCVMCPEHSRQPATVVDHIKPHKGDEGLFWDQDNWQPLCKPCHDIHKQRIEKGSEIPQKGLDGWPVDEGQGEGGSNP